VRTENFKFADLFSAHNAVNGGLNFFRGRVATLTDIGRNVEFAVWVLEDLVDDLSGANVEHVGEDVVEFEVRHGKTVLSAVFLAGVHTG
jgi:hypothetical protein